MIAREGKGTLLMVRMLLAWGLTVVGSTILTAVLVHGPVSGRALVDGVLGIGLFMGVPMLIFSVIIALPLSFHLKGLPIWLATISAVVLFGALAAALGTAIFPAVWKGAAQAFVAFAAMLGLFWGLLGYATVGSAAFD